MAHAIRITIGHLVFDARLNETGTSRRILEVLPVEGRASRWGDEVYFRVPATAEEGDERRTELQPGELAFWPPGEAFCIFWGPTPASEGDQPRAASDVVPIGRLTGDIGRLGETTDGQCVRVERAPD